MERTPLAPAPLVYAHRGDRSRAADNTLEAFDLAVEAGSDGIELDVRRTADGVLVMTHDPMVGELPPVADMTFAALREQAPHVPTFAETLEAVPDHIFLNVEIKHAAHEPGFEASRSIVDETVAMIEDMDDGGRVLISSFDPLSVQRATTIAPSMLRGLLVTHGVPFGTAVDTAREVGAAAVHPPMTACTGRAEGVVAQIHGAGLAMVVWNANTREEIVEIADARADVIITDHPGLARQLLIDGS